MKQSNWIFAYASAPGNSHLLENSVCQDSSSVVVHKNYAIAVVSDGAGSCLNSQFGSKATVEYCIRYFEQLIRSTKWDKKKVLPSSKEWHTKAKKTLLKVRKELERYSICNEWDLKSLSCTVIVNIILKNGILVTHIGDGRSGYCDSKGNWIATITPFHGELANETVFVTSDIWDKSEIDTYIESTVVFDKVKAICILTDGCERSSFECNLLDRTTNTFYDPNKPYPPFFEPNMAILKKLHGEGKSKDEINNLWLTFLTNGNEKLRTEPDDKTLIFGVRVDKKHKKK